MSRSLREKKEESSTCCKQAVTPQLLSSLLEHGWSTFYPTVLGLYIRNFYCMSIHIIKPAQECGSLVRGYCRFLSDKHRELAWELAIHL